MLETNYVKSAGSCHVLSRVVVVNAGGTWLDLARRLKQSRQVGVLFMSTAVLFVCGRTRGVNSMITQIEYKLAKSGATIVSITAEFWVNIEGQGRCTDGQQVKCKYARGDRSASVPPVST